METSDPAQGLGLADPRELTLDRLTQVVLEQQAKLSDHQLDDELLTELILKYVTAERRLHLLNEEKNRFLGMAAHDLRNPLATLRGMSQMLLEMELDEETRKEFLTVIQRVSGEMLGLVEDLLDVSVIESGKFDLVSTPLHLEELVRERCRLLTLTAQAKESRIETSLADLPQLWLDRGRMGQVVDNLLTNAIKFSPPGSVIRVDLAVEGERAQLAVSDQGPGVPPMERVRLFGHFNKLSVRPTAGEKSTGLGLAIVKRIVTAHQGEIFVEDAPGGGARFVVTLPLPKA